MTIYKHWRIETDSEQIAWLYFDKQNASVNTIDREVMEELLAMIKYLAHDQTHRGLVVASAKQNGFIAGADITEFTKFKDVDEAIVVLKLGQDILNELEALKMPVVCMIDGFCLGGGMELALACHYRVVEDGPKTRLGLPEVKLGIHPGWGGTVRLPRLIGAPQAMDLILSGRTVTGKAAVKMGMADVAVPKRQLVHAAKYYVLQHPPRHKPTLLQGLTNKKILRRFLSEYMRKQLRAKASPEHYPAPFQVLENWDLVGVDDLQAAYEREAKSCGKLFLSDTCQNLVRVFFLQERLKGLGKEVHFNPQHVHVIGAGTMGGDIAAWCALQGMTVTLQDMEARFIAPAIKRAYELFKEKLKQENLIQQALDRLHPDLHGHGIAKADVIIEAVIENLEVKQKLFKDLESKAKADAILATNTSSIPLDEINTALNNPGRLVGIHYFNPVAKMLLVEVVKGERTDPSVVDKAISFVRKLDKLPLPVKSSPGFLVNRILVPYLLEGMNLLEEGVPKEAIDKAMVQFGMPVGPVALADYVGLDVCLSVAKHFQKYFHTPVPQRLIDLVEQKKLGRKTGEGFYRYDQKGKQIKPKQQLAYDKPLRDLADRLVLCMLNESFACLREHVVSDADLLDAGMIFGAGFPPFRGGPIHYAKVQGVHQLYEQFVRLCGDKTAAQQEWEVA